MKLCIECKHHRPAETGAECAHADALSPVDGQPFLKCLERRLKGDCGPNGKFWVAK